MIRLIVLLLLWPRLTAAHDHQEPYGAWFAGLNHPVLGLCCSPERDCLNTEVRGRAGHYEALIDGRYPDPPDEPWQPVPEDAILKVHDNPTGGFVACWYGRIRCFVRAVES